MDSIRTLSIIAHGAGSAHRASRSATVTDEQNATEDFTMGNLERRRSSRVKKKPN